MNDFNQKGTAVTPGAPLPNRPSRSFWSALLKRALDLSLATLGFILLSPLFLAICFLVKLQDGGIIFHRRRVVGADGPFDAFKFRSMHPNADEILMADADLRERFEKNYKLTRDPRVTAVGSILRKYSLDELPQLFNVILGQMSLVGPRMITSQELDKYGEYASLVLSVKPGITGYWQVHGRQTVGYSRRVEMDVYYIQHWSMQLDLKILLQTPWKVLKTEGAF